MRPLNKPIITILGYSLPGIIAGDPFLKILALRQHLEGSLEILMCKFVNGSFLSGLCSNLSLCLECPCCPSLAWQTPHVLQDLKQTFFPQVVFPAALGKKSSLCFWSPSQAGTSTDVLVILDWSWFNCHSWTEGLGIGAVLTPSITHGMCPADVWRINALSCFRWRL